MVGKRPEIIEIESSQLEELLARAESHTLHPDDYQTIETLVKSYCSLIDLLQDKNTSLARLRRLLFGASTEKLRELLPDRTPPPPGGAPADPPELAGDRPSDNHHASTGDSPAPGADERKKKEKRARAKRRRQIQRFQANRGCA